MVARRLRISIAGELARAWGEFGGFGGQLCLPPHHLEACLGNNAKVMDRLSEEGGELLPHMARSRMDPSEASSVIFEPDRDRRLRVVDEQRRAYHLRTARSGACKNRGYPAPDSQGSSRDGPQEPASRNARKERPRQERESESRRAIPSSQDFK